MAEPRVSVIIPIRNRAHLIGPTIESILGQSLAPAEIILVDDGSTDGIKDAIAPFRGRQVRLLQNNGKGPGAARNTGFQHAHGEYIKFFDSDDIMSGNTLEVQVKTMLSTGKPYVTGPYFYASEVDGKFKPCKDIIYNYNPVYYKRGLKKNMIKGLFIPIPGMLFTRSFLQRLPPWPEAMLSSEDFLFLWNAANLEPLPAHNNSCAFIYRVHGKQTTGNNLHDTEKAAQKLTVFAEIYEKILSDNSLKWADKIIFRNHFYSMARFTKDNALKQKLLKLSGKAPELVWQTLRIAAKLDRVTSATDLPKMHGAIQGVGQAYGRLFNDLIEKG